MPNSSKVKKALRLITFFAIILITSILVSITVIFRQTANATLTAVDSGGAGGDARSSKEIGERVNKFYAYTKAQACYDSFKGGSSIKVYPSKIEQGYDYNVAYTTITVNYEYYGFNKKWGKGTPCSTSEINKIADALGLDVNIEKVLKKKAGYNKERCPEGASNQSDYTCWNQISSDDVANAIKSNILDKSDAGESTMRGADWFMVYDKAFDICVEGDSTGLEKYTSTTDVTGNIGDDGSSGTWKFSEGSTFDKPNDNGTYNSEVVYAKVDDHEYKFLGVGLASKIAHTVWYGARQTPRDNVSGGVEKNCDEIAQGVRENFPAYLSAINNNALEAGESESKADINSGLTSSDEAPEEDDSEDSCEAGFFGFGWIFCPGQNLVTELIDGLMGWVADMMEWTIVADQATDDTNTLQDVWQKLLNIANVVFAIIFMIMIYSMATSVGLSNYEIKKILPRLVVIVVAVNISFYICAALVDLSNILGSVMYSFIYSQASSGNAWNILGNLANNLTSSVLLVLAAFAFGGALVVALVVIITCLALRQVLLVVLIVISPIAIALYTLPNTAKWFRQWLNMFLRLLIIYPAFTSIWGAARLISNTFATTGGSDVPGFIMDFVCAIAPAVAIVPLFKASGTVIGTVAGAIAGSSAAKTSKSWINERTRRNPLTRGAARVISKKTGELSEKAASIPVIGGALRRGFRGAANYTSVFGNSLETKEAKLDERSLEAGKTANMGLSDSQLKSIAIDGKYTTTEGKEIEVDLYQRRAAMEKIGDSLSASEVESMMVNVSDLATSMKNSGRDREAKALLSSSLGAAKASGNLFMSASKQADYADNKFGSGNEARSNMTNAIAENASKLSQQEMSAISGKTNGYLQNKIKESGNNDYLTAYGKTAGLLDQNDKLKASMNAEALASVRDAANAYRQSTAATEAAAGAAAGTAATRVAAGAAAGTASLSQADMDRIVDGVSTKVSDDLDSIGSQMRSASQSTNQSLDNLQQTIGNNHRTPGDHPTPPRQNN